MPLEAAVVVLDNSEFSRNGDLEPSRWNAQQEAIELYINVVIDSNMESGMGLILGGGKQVRLLMTPTNDRDLIQGQFHKTRLEGNLQFSVALQQASLALKHRINKQQHQRIVAFVASPIEEEADTLVNLAKRLKKNNIAIDLINFGEQNEEHLKKLKIFFENVQKGSTSKFINIYPGMSATETLFSSLGNQSDFQAESGQQQEQVPQQRTGGQFSEYGGIDPNIDPEMAMIMKMSLEEEAQRLQQQLTQQIQQPQQQQQQQQQPQQQQQIQEEKVENVIEEENDELLEQARLLSIIEEPQQPQQQNQPAQEQQKQDTQNQLFQDQNFLDELLDDVNKEEEQESLLKKDDDKSKKD
ncbi:unnamed protein product (macronuclear) [Paramecium tetraurelia]|uniref:VWFA domain-containing protein n=1 Tax=Paramecium tetraurelia TaxID=5888 RepID=A0CY61_PARTE|nr:uncharacterized protein GSPATT00039066001 [Paramecium tetraurelia]CAK75728.1 unnamed protein product [Paramecium tetraurelia]|eukprot:XP_001443125.1 hypothetical protein (macronuclear) [Paramecium tetraurelia strain d4-2]